MTAGDPLGADISFCRVRVTTIGIMLRRVCAKLGVTTRAELTAEYARVTS